MAHQVIILISSYYRVVVYRAPLQELVLHCWGCCGLVGRFCRKDGYKIGRFTKQDIRELCPSLSLSSVEGALRKLVESGELRREGNGKNTCYYRTE